MVAFKDSWCLLQLKDFGSRLAAASLRCSRHSISWRCIIHTSSQLVWSAVSFSGPPQLPSVVWVILMHYSCASVLWLGLVSIRYFSPLSFPCRLQSTDSTIQVDLSSLNTFQQLILFFLIIVGSPIIISSNVLYVRKRAFESKFQGISQERAQSRQNSVLNHQTRSDIDLPSYSCPGNTGPYGGDQCDQSNSAAQTTPTDPTNLNHIHWVGDDQIMIGNVKPRYHHHRVFPMAGVGARKDLNNDPRDVPPNHSLYDGTELAGFKGVFRGTQKFFLASKAFISRNSQFHGLTPEEREELGGVEYRAVSFLSIIVPLYFFSFLILGAIGVGSWLTVNRPRVAQDNGLSPFFTGAFFAISAFGNSGMALLDANMTALQTKFVTNSFIINEKPILTISTVHIPLLRWECWS